MAPTLRHWGPPLTILHHLQAREWSLPVPPKEAAQGCQPPHPAGAGQAAGIADRRGPLSVKNSH